MKTFLTVMEIVGCISSIGLTIFGFAAFLKGRFSEAAACFSLALLSGGLWRRK